MPKRVYHKGKEKFNVDKKEQDFTVCDFWAFAFGDLLDNTRRGALAEFIVAKALKINTDIPRRDWSEYDLDYKGIRVEVKCSAYIQSWNLDTDKISELRFSISPAQVFDDATARYVGEKQRNSDVYVFCVYVEKDKTSYDILDLSKWEFYVVKTADLQEKFGDKKSVTLKNLIANFDVKKSGYLDLKETIDKMFIK